MNKFKHIIVFIFSLYASTSFCLPGPNSYDKDCRSVPGSKHWPAETEWSSLNKTLNGQLLAPLPPAIVCDPSRKSTYDEHACAVVGKKWPSSLFHTEDPVSVQTTNFQNDACLPTAVFNRSTVCHTKPFARYVVNATKAEHVAAAIKFAAKHKVRLVVKGTGHDYLGRSAGEGLLIWTHHIKGIDIIASFKPEACHHCNGTPAVKIFAGEMFGDVYAKAKKHNVIPVGGADGSVGIGGYLLGGGHSPISAKFGLAVDNALEIKVVTPSGEIFTANQYQNQDLFWALKGGGGSTFGVLISATLRTFPTFPVSEFSILFSSTKEEAKGNNNHNYYSALAYLHQLIPSLSEGNLTGYNFLGPLPLLSGGNVTDPKALIKGPQFFFFSGWALDRTEADTKSLLRPLWKRLNSTRGLSSEIKVHPQADIYSVVGTSVDTSNSGAAQYLTSGRNSVTASRLWDKNALSDEKALISTFRAMQPGAVSGLMVSGPGVREAANPDDVSVTPTWRETYIHMTTGVTWGFRDAKAKEEALKRNQNVLMKALKDLAPHMGCYLNEADVYDPEFQESFWGDNYERLLRIKRKYDPNDVFVCKACVGSEDWSIQSTGEICRKTPSGGEL